MEAATRGSGKMIGSMDKEEKQILRELTEKGNGRKIRQLGCTSTTTKRVNCSRYMMKTNKNKYNNDNKERR